jgi:hypothetical protein
VASDGNESREVSSNVSDHLPASKDHSHQNQVVNKGASEHSPPSVVSTPSNSVTAVSSGEKIVSSKIKDNNEESGDALLRQVPNVSTPDDSTLDSELPGKLYFVICRL